MVCKGGIAYPVAMLHPPPVRHAANLTGEICQPSKFGQDRSISLAGVACQRLVGELTLGGEVSSRPSPGADCVLRQFT